MTVLARRLFQKASKSKLSLILFLRAMIVVRRGVAMTIPLVREAPVVPRVGRRSWAEPMPMTALNAVSFSESIVSPRTTSRPESAVEVRVKAGLAVAGSPKLSSCMIAALFCFLEGRGFCGVVLGGWRVVLFSKPLGKPYYLLARYYLGWLLWADPQPCL